MARKIRVINTNKAKDITSNNVPVVSMALGVFDDNVPFKARFVQTESMTVAGVGITEYGAIYVDPNTISVSDATIDLLAVCDDGDEVSVSMTVQQLLNKGAGNTLS